MGYEKESDDIFIKYLHIDTDDFLDKYLDRVMNLLSVFSKYIYTGVGNYRNDKDTIKLNNDTT